MKICVLYGGTSAEREVSLSSGKGIIEALKKKNHDVIGIDFRGTKECLLQIMNLDVDLFFIGLHGRLGEDGRVQGLLDLLKIPYVGSNVLGSALAMDKARSKKMFALKGIRVAKEKLVEKHSFIKESFSHELTYPVVVKPNHEGSTIGLTIAQNEAELIGGIDAAFNHDDVVLLEEFISGQEVTVAVMGNKGNAKALPIVEIVPKNAYYDYESKYAPGMSEHIVPARVSDEMTNLLQEQSVLAHEALGCDVYSRVDFIVPKDGGNPVILEVNTLPGMTPTSLYPDAAREIGLSYEDMIETLVELSMKK
ncbi:D-alanine--D-alanine ligase family protein [Anaerobacillus isosaccharinicus]|uniref:D-alanine--D-alanine ligase n=1 Tax=Anaerobacillus isosaccharinicus TaxID=1532552 RepID=A0A1S2M4K6_9BACI|nr:D-alanine--D-alanine ligase [Anaerobacillus isosaccharinicus]MBA5585820.1 D-alanine--D-alanine ligase [Anaerobacillus isosaccharinicus]QOY35883.1 D-alanine--D-alanine ligase [Anaerobacillus isosaccharinicus]